MTRKYIYCMVIGNEYDVDNPLYTTDDIEIAYNWIRKGCEQVALLDSLSLEYCGYMDYEDLPEFRADYDDWEDDEL